MERSWGERRFLYSGIVFLATLAVLLFLSDGFQGLIGDEGEAIVSVAVVVGAGISGYPLGLILYAPFDFIFRIMGNYDFFYKNRDRCNDFVAKTAHAAKARPSSAARILRDSAECAAKKRRPARQFITAMYERFAPEAVKRPAQSRWERFHTAGGLLFALVLGVGLSPLAVLAVDDAAPWWDSAQILTAVSIVAFVVMATLLFHMWAIAREAVAIDTVWLNNWLATIERRPEILEIAALDPKLDEWVLKLTGSVQPAESVPTAGSGRALGWVALLLAMASAVLLHRTRGPGRLRNTNHRS